MSIFVLRLIVVLVGIVTIASYQLEPSVALPQNLTESPLSDGDNEKIAGIVSAFQATEWLGPLAPIAISPFFGITILAGIAQFGGDWIGTNSFITTNPLLNNPTVFWVFLGLTFLTSIPRFTKVSKPAAQAIDQLEAYAGIITIVLIRVLSAVSESDPASAETAMVIQMGVLSFTADVLFSIAAVINIIVINTVKFFFEVMVWLVPVPFIDGVLEVANKSLCAGLMAVYVWSPAVATILNLVMFTVCLLAFRWVNRRVRYLRSVICEPLWAIISPSYAQPNRNELVVFPQLGVGPFPAKMRLLLQSTNDGWQLVQPRMFLAPKTMQLSRGEYRMEMQTGLLLNSITLQGNESNAKLLFSKRYSRNLTKLAELIDANQSTEALQVDLRQDMGKA